VTISVLPFLIGRRSDLPLCIQSRSVSKLHAEITGTYEDLRLRDLQSRNGTFVNGNRVGDGTPIKAGDIIHFANLMFSLEHESAVEAELTIDVTSVSAVATASRFQKLIEKGGLVPHYQPVVRMASGVPVGYEVLARSDIEGLRSAKDLFAMAQSLNREADLSVMARTVGVRNASQIPGSPKLFLNIHPAETDMRKLMNSLSTLRAQAATTPIVVEVPEGAIVDLQVMRELRSGTRDLGMEMAYDDFGAGQARLIELIEVPSDYLKFDINLIRGIDAAQRQKTSLLEGLVRVALDLGIAPIAEGVESAAEAEACAAIGFPYAQGYYFGKPARVRDIVKVQAR
jgi:EAL domain-containing protein (putative c-di-GMP-specific phosphodiesterase class I)